MDMKFRVLLKRLTYANCRMMVIPEHITHLDTAVYLWYSVLIAELLKGFIPVFFSAKYIGRESVLFAFVMAAPVMGHAFSVYYFYMKFRMKYINRGKNMPRVFADGNTGGKAIAVSFGVMLGLYPDTMPLTILIACYLFFSLILRIKSHARRTIITFGSVIALSLFFVKEKA